MDTVLVCIGVLAALGVLALTAAGRAAATAAIIVYGLGTAASAVGLCTAVTYLLAAHPLPETAVLPLGIPWLGAHLRLDVLSAFFLGVVDLGGGAACLYGIGYGRHERSPRRVLPFFPLFLAAMHLVVLADDAFTFLFAWELMSLTSWALVVSDHRSRANVRAGQVYLVMASFGTLALLLAFGLLAGPDGLYAFADMRAAPHSPTTVAVVLALLLLGAGSKAGLLPMHVWLPLAHPAAPSHVSALMSGVMTKVAIYGFIRVAFGILGPVAPGGSMVVLGLGGVTAVMGVLYALMQHDLKRLLAYHTVENIGIIFIGLGLAFAFQTNGMPRAAALAMTAALFHVLNHMIFKSLLFFGAGAVQTATGERDLEHLGGLIHRMPVTSFTFLVGCAAISALPPLNGFVSEWLTFQAILESPNLPLWGLKLMVPMVGAALALSAALAAACFIKAFGVTFLSRPRGPAAAQATEVDRFSRTAMALFALLCLLAGIFPGMVINALSPVVSMFFGEHMPAQEMLPWFTVVPIVAGRSSYNGLVIFVFIAIAASAAVFAIHHGASRAKRRAPPWDCGYPEASPATQYSASSFAQPIRRVFGTTVFRVREVVLMPHPGDLRPARLRVVLQDIVWDILYLPVAAAVGFVADRLDRLQYLTIRKYLGYVLGALVVLLLAFAIWL